MSALTTGLGVWAALEHGLFGFVAAMGASYVIALLAAQRLAGPLPRPRFERDAARRLVAVGLPIMGSNLLKILLWNVDKLLIWLLMGKVALGTYALQAQITNALMLLPAGVSEVFYPHLLSEIGRSRSRSTARAYLERGTDLLVRCMLPVLALTCLAFHLPIRWWMPEYVDAIAPGVALVLASFFPVAGALPANVLVALRGQRTLLAISGASVAVATVAVTAAILTGGGYLGVALGVSLGLFTRAALVIGAALRRSGAERAAAGRFVGRLGFGFALLLGAVALARFAVPDRNESLSEDAIQTLLRCGLALVVVAPWALAAWLRPRSATPTLPDRERGTL